MKPYTLSQNAEKRIIVPYIAGNRKRAFLDFLLYNPSTQHCVSYTARYLGAMFSKCGNNV